MLFALLLASAISMDEPAATQTLPPAVPAGTQVLSRNEAEKIRGTAYHAGVGGRVPSGYRCRNAFVSSSKSGRVSVLCRP